MRSSACGVASATCVVAISGVDGIHGHELSDGAQRPRHAQPVILGARRCSTARAVDLGHIQPASRTSAVPGSYGRLRYGSHRSVEITVRLKADTTARNPRRASALVGTAYECSQVPTMFCGAGCGYSETRSLQAECRRCLAHTDIRDSDRTVMSRSRSA